MADEIQDELLELAQNPLKMTGDGGDVVERPLVDLIKADQYLRAKTAAEKAHRGIRITRLVPPGAD
jgi:hypothetical protein